MEQFMKWARYNVTISWTSNCDIQPVKYCKRLNYFQPTSDESILHFLLRIVHQINKQEYDEKKLSELPPWKNQRIFCVKENPELMTANDVLDCFEIDSGRTTRNIEELKSLKKTADKAIMTKEEYRLLINDEINEQMKKMKGLSKSEKKKMMKLAEEIIMSAHDDLL